MRGRHAVFGVRPATPFRSAHAGRARMVPRGAWLVLLVFLAGCGAPAARAVRHVVTIAKVAYVPAVLEVAAGDTVEWRNQDLVPHTVSARDGAWDSGVLAPDSSWRLVVSGSDSVRYDCHLHPTMHGVLFVRSR